MQWELFKVCPLLMSTIWLEDKQKAVVLIKFGMYLLFLCSEKGDTQTLDWHFLGEDLLK